MARFSTGYTVGITSLQMQAIRLMLDGCNAEETARLLFDNRSTDNPMEIDQGKLRRNVNKVRKWRTNPAFVAAYRDVLRQDALEDYGKSMAKLRSQVGDSNGWLANKAANDVLARVAPLVTGEEDKQITVKVEGLPTLGTPEPETDSE